MKVRKYPKATADLKQAREHQVPAMKFVYAVASVVFGFVFAYSIMSGLHDGLNTLANASLIFWVSIGFLIAFAQLNHLFANQLINYTENLQNQLLETVDYLLQQMSIWREQLSSFLAMTPRPEISFFDRLSDLLGLTQLPLLNAPLAFRS